MARRFLCLLASLARFLKVGHVVLARGTPLHCAAMQGRSECVRILMQHGASPVSLVPHPCAALHAPHMLWPLPRIACMSRDLSCAQAVLDHCGLSPLTVAVNDAVATMCAIHCIPPLFPHRMPHASLSWRAGCPVEGVSNKPAAMLHTRTQAAPQRAHIE